MLNLTGDGVEAQIYPERGGLVGSLKLEGREVLYLDESTLLDPSANVRGGIPILFPVCGPHPVMKQHGVARQAQWTVLRVDDVVEMELEGTFPFPFRLRFVYEVQDGGLLITQHFENTGREVTAFQTGLHPYFLAEDKSDLAWEIPATHFRDNEDGRRLREFLGAVDVDRVSDWEFPDLQAMTAAVGPVRLDFSEQYKYLVAWNLPEKPFVCLEPWTGPRFGLQEGVGLIELPPGEGTTLWVRISTR